MSYMVVNGSAIQKLRGSHEFMLKKISKSIDFINFISRVSYTRMEINFPGVLPYMNRMTNDAY